MRIGIIGGGAIGLLLSSLLGKDHDVTIYVRRCEQLQAIKEEGVSLSESNRTTRVASKMFGDWDRHDLMFVCVKQYHLDELIPLLDQLDFDIPLVFLQNGMGHLEAIDRLENHQAIVGVMEHGAMRVTDTIVNHTGKGVLKVAPYRASNISMYKVKELSAPDFPIQFMEDFYQLLAKKLVVNTVINPLTALFEVENGRIAEDPHLKKLAYMIGEEACEVLQLSFDEEWDRVMEVVRLTAANLSSMAKDIQEGRRTEVDAILGYLMERATKKHPNIRFAYHAIKAKEGQRSRSE
ncbi:2-dehydropantoate 2-reductase [Thalassobacillus hwangdonensis]|uniref:2-dehydropantoate 2-reductase n=1 Tax=Thalassobacillus hwangdonensis TaxID=546108 RepID=A0ABW3KYP0_9BACI